MKTSATARSPRRVVPALRRLIREEAAERQVPSVATVGGDRHDDDASSRPPRLTFDLPPTSKPREPAEARGMTRDGVRLMVAERSTDA